MPVKSNAGRQHHTTHKKEKRTKRFLKVYAPYIPLTLIVLTGILINTQAEANRFSNSILGYAINTSDQGLLDATNKHRAEEGLQPLRLNPKLDEAAQAKAIDMATHDYWAHVTPDGRQPWDFIEKVGYSYRKAAENLAYGFATSDTTVTGWMNSASHRANVMDPDLREVGFGIQDTPSYQGHGEETIVVAMYGLPSSQESASAATLPTDDSATSSPAIANTKPKDISFIQSLTNGEAPWSGILVGVVLGAGVMYLLIKHAREIRRAVREGEKFVIHHPLFDVTLVSLIVLATIVSQRVGSIY